MLVTMSEKELVRAQIIQAVCKNGYVGVMLQVSGTLASARFNV